MNDSERKIRESTEYFNDRCDRIELRDGAREKYHENGLVKPLPGLTVVNWFEQGEGHSEACRGFLEELTRRVREAGLADKFAFLPPETLHVTLYDLVVRPNDELENAVKEKVSEAFAEFQGKLAGARMKLDSISISAGISLVGWVSAETPADFESIVALRRCLHEKLGGTQLSLAEPNAFMGHVSFAYIVNSIGPDEYARLKPILRDVNSSWKPSFTVRSAELRKFQDMETWSPPLATIELTA